MSEQLQKWIRIREAGTRRWHAVFCSAYGLQFTYCARTSRVGNELEITELQNVSGKCGCCRSRLAHAFLVPDSLRAVRDGKITPIARKKRQRADESAFKQGKLYA